MTYRGPATLALALVALLVPMTLPALTVRAYLENFDYAMKIDSITFNYTHSMPVTRPTPDFGGTPFSLDSCDLSLAAFPDQDVILFRFLAGPLPPYRLYPIVADSWYEVSHRPTTETESRLKFHLVTALTEGPDLESRPQLETPAPNPFQTLTRFGLTNPVRQTVTLTISDAAGRTVRELTKGKLAAGNYSFSWDGRNANGQAVPDGIYFCRIQTSGMAATQKVCLRR